MTKEVDVKNSKITIGIPLYTYDRRTLFSVVSALSQEDEICKIILSDDGDNQSLAELASGIDKRILYVKNKSRLGMWANFVETYKLATSRYFTWLAADDFISPSFGKDCMNSIRTNPGFVAWMGLPNTHNSDRGTRISGLMMSRKSYNPYLRVLDIFTQGKYGAFYYSVVDKSKVSIYPLERLLSWPYHQVSYDYVWMMNLAIHGNIFQTPSLLYFYDQSNWTPEARSKNQYKLQSIRLSTPLIYLSGILFSFKSYLDTISISDPLNTNQIDYPFLKSWENILTMLVSKYLFRNFNDSEIREANSVFSFRSLLMYTASLADVDNKTSTSAQAYIESVIKDVEQNFIISSILDKPHCLFFSPIWYHLPSTYLTKYKLENLLTSLMFSSINFSLWTV